MIVNESKIAWAIKKYFLTFYQNFCIIYIKNWEKVEKIKMGNLPKDYYEDVNSIEELLDREYRRLNALQKLIYWIQRYFWLTFIVMFLVGFLVGYHYYAYLTN